MKIGQQGEDPLTYNCNTIKEGSAATLPNTKQAGNNK